MTMEKINGKLFYRKEDTETLRFFKAPKVLYYSLLYRQLSLPAKILYGILLDRLALSLKNGWVDDQDRIFVIFRGRPAQNDTRKFQDKPSEDLSLTELLNVDHRSLRKYKDDLIKHHLLAEIRSGQGKSNRLYLLKPVTESKDLYKKEAPEHLLYSEDLDTLPIYEVHELLLNEYGSVALEKALELTTGQKVPVKGYYAYLKNILEGFRNNSTDKRHQFISQQESPFFRKTSSTKYFLKKSS